MVTKRCNKCGKRKPHTEFAYQRNSPDKLRYSCKVCYNTANRARYKADPSAAMHRFVRRQYGVSLKEYEAILRRPCAICGKKSECLDHDHATGANRAGLCSACNQMLGQARDNPAILRAGADYLDTHDTLSTQDATKGNP